MNIQILASLPPEWSNAKPVRTYETRFLALGFRRYDIERKMISSFEQQPDGTIFYTETPADDAVFSRSYATEITTVVVYSESPRVWVEQVSPHERFVFVQQPTQAV